MDEKTLEAVIVAAGGVVVFNLLKMIFEYRRSKGGKKK